MSGGTFSETNAALLRPKYLMRRSGWRTGIKGRGTRTLSPFWGKFNKETSHITKRREIYNCGCGGRWAPQQREKHNSLKVRPHCRKKSFWATPIAGEAGAGGGGDLRVAEEQVGPRLNVHVAVSVALEHAASDPGGRLCLEVDPVTCVERHSTAPGSRRAWLALPATETA